MQGLPEEFRLSVKLPDRPSNSVLHEQQLNHTKSQRCPLFLDAVLLRMP